MVKEPRMSGLEGTWAAAPVQPPEPEHPDELTQVGLVEPAAAISSVLHVCSFVSGFN